MKNPFGVRRGEFGEVGGERSGAGCCGREGDNVPDESPMEGEATENGDVEELVSADDAWDERRGLEEFDECAEGVDDAAGDEWEDGAWPGELGDGDHGDDAEPTHSDVEPEPECGRGAVEEDGLEGDTDDGEEPEEGEDTPSEEAFEAEGVDGSEGSRDEDEDRGVVEASEDGTSGACAGCAGGTESADAAATGEETEFIWSEGEEVVDAAHGEEEDGGEAEDDDRGDARGGAIETASTADGGNDKPGEHGGPEEVREAAEGVSEPWDAEVFADGEDHGGSN